MNASDDLPIPFPEERRAAVPSLPPTFAAEVDTPTPMAADEPAASLRLAEWKAELRRDLETWLASINEVPEAAFPEEEDPNDAPDFYSFYAQIAAANAEWRKANRRTAEAMNQWGETLARFESGLGPLREITTKLAAAQPAGGRMSRAHCLVLVEVLDRMHRVARAYDLPPVAKQSWWRSSDAAWRSAWDAQHRALDILVSHLEAWLAKEGVTRLLTVGRVFDPAFMMAVAADPDSTRPAQSILEELAAGYMRDDELLRAAQVRVSRLP